MMYWQRIEQNEEDFVILRTPVPGGWLVIVERSVTFVPDKHHLWDGSNLIPESSLVYDDD